MILSKDFLWYLRTTQFVHILFTEKRNSKHTVFTINLYTDIINERYITKATKHINYAILILIFFIYSRCKPHASASSF